MSGQDMAAPAAAEAYQTAVLLGALEAMEATLSVAEALVREGRGVDLAGLDAEMGRLCAAALAAPETALPAVRLRLLALCRGLDRLAAGLAPP